MSERGVSRKAFIGIGGIAGSSDDRTPLGKREGMCCMDCHTGHGRKADASRGSCSAHGR